VALLLLARRVQPTVTVVGADLLVLAQTVLAKVQILEYAMEMPGSTTLEATQILALTVLLSLTANLAFIMTLIVCGVVLLPLAKNGALL
jgi:hypothetical protein